VWGWGGACSGWPAARSRPRFWRPPVSSFDTIELESRQPSGVRFHRTNEKARIYTTELRLALNLHCELMRMAAARA
jgi:hypothetical protein